MTIRATVGGEITLHVDPEWPELAPLLREHEFANPELATARRAKLRHAEFVPDTWAAWRRVDGGVVVPRGSVASVQAWARASGVDVAWTSQVQGGREPLGPPIDDLGVTPRDYQRDAVERIVRQVQGVVVMPCGGGKTITGALAVGRIGRPAVVLAPTRDIVQQWRGALEKVGVEVVRREPGRGQAVVSTVAGAGSVAGSLASAEVLVCDECHHGPARTWSAVVGQSPARWRVGLTATPGRADGWSFAIPLLFGSTLVDVPQRRLLDLGYLWAPWIVPVRGEWEPRTVDREWAVACAQCTSRTVVDGALWLAGKDTPCGKCGARLPTTIAAGQAESHRLVYGRANAALMNSQEHIDAVVELSRIAVQAGLRTLTLVGTKALAARVGGRASALGIDADYVHGATPQRGRLIDDLRSGRLDLLVATQLADEGLDVPELDCLANTAGGSSAERAVQRASRVCRPEGSGRPVVIDLVHGGPWRRQYSKRRAAYSRAFGKGCIASSTPVRMSELRELIDRGRAGYSPGGR